MNFENDCLTSYHDMRRENRLRDLVASALWLCGYSANEGNIADVLEDLRGRYGDGADKQIVAALNEEYLTDLFKRKRDERSREKFADELAERVWATVKDMTGFTDDQKVIPEDLALRVGLKAGEEQAQLDALRRKLSAW